MQSKQDSKNPLITVLLPCYNASEYLEDALTSIINQSYKNLEILCIDDGSSDNTLQLLQSFAERDNRIRVVINESNLKLIATLNKGIDLANGEYIARMDADDISYANRITNQLDYLIANQLDIIGSKAESINEKGESNGAKFIHNTTLRETVLASFFLTPLLHPSVFGRAEIFKGNPYSKAPESMHTEDFELWARLIRGNYKIGNIEKELIKIRVNSKSVSHKFEAIQKENFAICAKIHYETYFNKTVNQDIYNIVANRFDIIDAKSLAKALKIISFIHKTLNPDNDNRLRLICEYQRLDILIQTLKKGKVILKLRSIIKMGFLISRNIFNSELRIYIKTKF